MVRVDSAYIEKLCQKVGAFMIEQSKLFTDNDVEYKSNRSLVSYVDKSSELMLIDGLLPLFPEAGFLVEEKSVSYDPNKEIIWIIDPLDGTTNYLHHLPFYCISIALQVKGELQQGFIYHVSANNFYSATLGQGASLNGKPISVNSTKEISQGVFATGFPHGLSINLDFYFNIFKEFTLQSRGIRRIGSAALDLAFLAEGRFSGFYEMALHPWDIAAGIIIVQEAGGHITDFEGAKDMLKSGNIIASHSGIHMEMLRIIQRHL